MGELIPDISELGKEIRKRTGITPEEEAGAADAQKAVEQTTRSASKFFVDRIAGRTGEETKRLRQPDVVTLIPPFSEDEQREAEQSLKEAGIEFKEDFYRGFKLHLLSSLIFSSKVGVDRDKVIQALGQHIQQEREKSPYLAKTDYKSAGYFVEGYVVREMARRKGLEVSERKQFMVTLASSLNERERGCLAQYIASTQTPPDRSSTPFDVLYSHNEYLLRQNIAVAIAPQSFKQDLVEAFLSQKGARRGNFLVVMANPRFRKTMPLGALLANEYRIRPQWSSLGKEMLPIGEALKRRIEMGYVERWVRSGFKGLLPFEELAGLVVADGLKKLPREDLESKFSQVIPRVLEAEQPLVELEEAFPDIRLFYGGDEIDRITEAINVLKEAKANPDRVPPRAFWNQVFTEPKSTYDSYDFLSWTRRKLVRLMYQAGGKNYLQRWRKVTESFVVSKGQERNGEPLTLTLFRNGEIGISGKDGPLFSLIRRDDGHWYPTGYWNKEAQEQVFSIEGMSYDELQERIANAPFQYKIEDIFLKEILRESFNDLAESVYKQIKSQVDMEALRRAGVYISHAAIAYREESPLGNFQYLIGDMNPYGAGVYSSIFDALVRHLWQQGKLNEDKMGFNIVVPLTGESYTVRHPLLGLRSLSFEEFLVRLKETGSDVRIPEVTIRNTGGYELRAKAWVYETLLKLKKLGFDAVLGKTMAGEFNRQAARIYVENALVKLGFLPKGYQEEKPLLKLQSTQQKLYSKALELGFTIPLDKDCHLKESLTSPLTWGKERELVQFLEKRLTPDELQEFYNKVDVDVKYFEIRGIAELFLNFAAGWGWNQFDRSDEFPTRKTRHPLGDFVMMGSFVISTQAQERFKVAKRTWKGFLGEIQREIGSLEDDSFKQRLGRIKELGEDLVTEIDRMSQSEVTEWAEKIIKGEMAAVGRDMQKPIEVKAWDDFYEAIRQLLNTARLVLVYRPEKGRFGWEVSTDEEELL